MYTHTRTHAVQRFVSAGRFASLASSGYQSDMTIPTEDSTPAPAQSSAYRDASQSAGPGAAEHRVFSKHNDMLVFLLCVSGTL